MAHVNKTHPMFVVAAAAVTAFSLTGIAVLGGWLPLRSAPATPGVALPMASSPAASTGAASTTQQSVAAPQGAPAATTAATTAATEPKHRPIAHAATPRPATRQAASHEETGGTTAPAAGATRVSTPAPANDNGIYVESARPTNSQTPAATQPQTVCNECGTVESVREIGQPGEGSWIGSVAGGVLGGLLGNQVGRGNGKTLATVAGAVGGAFAGREVEKHVRTDKQYQVTVRFDDGSVRSYTETSEPAVRSGDRVRASGNRLDPL